jgi:hypothetical protein
MVKYFPTNDDDYYESYESYEFYNCIDLKLNSNISTTVTNNNYFMTYETYKNILNELNINGTLFDLIFNTSVNEILINIDKEINELNIKLAVPNLFKCVSDLNTTYLQTYINIRNRIVYYMNNGI